jgi:DMSO reductase family type II enzyme heme b subunit
MIQQDFPPVSSQPEAESVPVTVAKPSRLRRALRSPLALILPAILMAVGLWAVDFQPVSSDANKLFVAYEPGVSDADLLNPRSPVWSENRENRVSTETDAQGNRTNRLSTTIIPMSGQYILPQEGGSILEMRARAAFNNNTMAVLVQWRDETKNATNPIGKEEYSDSVALQFPLKQVAGHQPFRCMGQQGAEVNIWQWKAERDPAQAGNSTLFGASGGKAAKNYIGPGKGYLRDGNGFDPDSASFYDEQTKTWNVVFRRSLTTPDDRFATQFKPGVATLSAFALWDGGKGERLSKKSVSTWVDFIFQPGDPTPQSIINMVVTVGTLVLLVISCFVAWKLLPGGTTVKRAKD